MSMILVKSDEMYFRYEDGGNLSVYDSLLTVYRSLIKIETIM